MIGSVTGWRPGRTGEINEVAVQVDAFGRDAPVIEIAPRVDCMHQQVSDAAARIARMPGFHESELARGAGISLDPVRAAGNHHDVLRIRRAEVCRVSENPELAAFIAVLKSLQLGAQRLCKLAKRIARFEVTGWKH